jgi:hypothetical protein
LLNDEGETASVGVSSISSFICFSANIYLYWQLVQTFYCHRFPIIWKNTSLMCLIR